MPGGIKRKQVKLSISVVAHQQLAILATQKNQSVSDYIQSLVIYHLEELGLPIYYDPTVESKSEQEEETKAGQVP